ncbi:MAG: DinB family protein [Bacteroidia bacterium]
MHNETIRKHLVKLLEGNQSYTKMETALQEVPFELIGLKPDGFPYSIWQLVEHIRISQWDIIEFSGSADHVSPKWPDEYWTKETGPKTRHDWQKSLKSITEYQLIFIDIINNPDVDLFSIFDWGSGQTMFREVLVLAEHNAYHTAQILLLKKLLMTRNFF